MMLIRCRAKVTKKGKLAIQSLRLLSDAVVVIVTHRWNVVGNHLHSMLCISIHNYSEGVFGLGYTYLDSPSPMWVG